MNSSLQLYITSDKHLEVLVTYVGSNPTINPGCCQHPHTRYYRSITKVLHDYKSTVSKLSSDYKVCVLKYLKKKPP